MRARIERFGRIRPGRWARHLNVLFLVLVVTAFAVPVIWREPRVRLIAIEFGVLLLSFKFAYFLRNEARMIHFEFWTLSSIELRLTEMLKEMRRENGRIREKLGLLLDRLGVEHSGGGRDGTGDGDDSHNGQDA